MKCQHTLIHFQPERKKKVKTVKNKYIGLSMIVVLAVVLSVVTGL